jgi:hypothetical protein
MDLVLHTCWGRCLPLWRAAYILLYVVWRLKQLRQICHVGEDDTISVSYYWHLGETGHASHCSVVCVRRGNTWVRLSRLFETAQLLIKPGNSDHFVLNMYDTFTYLACHCISDMCLWDLCDFGVSVKRLGVNLMFRFTHVECLWVVQESVKSLPRKVI